MFIELLCPAVSHDLQRNVRRGIPDVSVETGREALAASRETDRIISMTRDINRSKQYESCEDKRRGK